MGMFDDLIPAEQSAGMFDDLVPQGDPDDIVKRGSILPLVRERDGDIAFGFPEFLQGPRQTIVDILEGRKGATDVSPQEVLDLGLIFGVGAGGRALTTTANRATKTPVATEGQRVAASGERLGVDLPRAVTSDTTAVQQAGKISSNVPVGGTPIRQASQKAIDDLGRAADDAQSALGSGSVESAGGALRAGIETHITEVAKARIDDAFNAVAKVVDPNKAAPLNETASIAQRILNERAAAGIPGKSQALKLVEQALARKGGLTFEGTRNLRTFVGQLLDNPSALPVKMPKAELKLIYGALSRDLDTVAQAAGGKRALAQLQKANALAKRQSDINKQINQVLKLGSNEGAFEKIMAAAGSRGRADIKLLGRLRGAVDNKTWDEIGSAVISRLGRDADGNFTPDRFVTAYGKLSDAGKKLLFRSTGKNSVANALDDIAQVSRRFKELNQFANPSGTGQTVLGGATGVGLVTDPLTAMSSVLGARALSTFLSQPKTATAAAKWSKAYMSGGKALEAATRVLAVEIAKMVKQPELTARIESELLAVVNLDS